MGIEQCIQTFWLQTLSKKHGPWPAARDAPPIIQRARAIKLGVLGEKTRRAPEGSFD